MPPISEVVQAVDEPIFSYRGSDDCGYFWTDFSLNVRDANGSVIENPEEHLLFDLEHRTITYLKKQIVEEFELEITMKAKLSDEWTQVDSTFKVTF